MTLGELTTILSVIVPLLGMVGAATAWFLKWRKEREKTREEQEIQDRKAEYKLADAHRTLDEVDDARRDRWILRENPPLNEPIPEDLEQEAQSLLLEALDFKPSPKIKARILLELGRLKHNWGERDLAERELSKAIRLNPQLAGAYEERGLVRWWLGHTVGAYKDMEHAYRLSSDSEREEIKRRLRKWRREIDEEKRTLNG